MIERQLIHCNGRHSVRWPLRQILLSPYLVTWIALLAFVRCSAQPAPLTVDKPIEKRTQVAEQSPRAAPEYQLQRTGGELSLVSIEPPLGTILAESSVLHAILDYRIVNPPKTSAYVIEPFFSDSAGNDRTFNAAGDFASVLPLSKSSGRFELRYAIHREWHNAKRLARPPIIWFELIERDSDLTMRVIAKLGPFHYE